ncbi:MAG: LamG domain-containing protein, partial [Candidatus Pacebacteria bacterium]|nr:LamG domain-containing protein [Candidatus Paceibacterota bacterium]
VDDYVNAGTGVNPTNAITIEYWFELPYTTGGTTIWHTLSSKGATVGWWDEFNQGTGELTWRLYTAASDLIGQASYTQSYSANIWYHLVETYDGARLKIYVNGQEKNSVGGSGVMNTSGADLFIGQHSGGGQRWNGLIDEVRVYNRALSVEEVRYHYNRGGPVGYWKFNEGLGSSAYDSSGNNNTGTLYGGMATSTADGSGWKAGKYGSALAFDGTNDYVACSNNSILNPTTAITVGAWVKPKTYTSWDGIVSKWSTAGNRGYILLLNGFGGFIFSITTDGSTAINASGPLSLTAENWYYVAGTYDGSVLKVYINGILLGQTSAMGNIFASSDSLRIGKDGASWTNYFNGIIDDVRIYNYARNPQQILQDYNAGMGIYFK